MAYTPPTLEDGTEVPSVTRIIKWNLAWGVEGLMEWQMSMVRYGRDPNQIRDKAGAVGTYVHECIEHQDPDFPVSDDIREYLSKGDLDKARTVYALYMKWAERHSIIPAATEQTLVSRKYMYGGTVDFVGEKDGEPWLVDYKTTNMLKPQHFIQLAAYQHLYLENEGKMLPAGILHLKDDRQPTFYPGKNMPDMWNIFKHCLILNEYREKVEASEYEPG